MKQIIAPVLSNEEIMPGVHLLWAEAPQIAGAAQPGQFVMVRTSEDHDPLLRRPLSIHRVVENGALALLFEVVGRGTDWLAQRKAGERLDLLGPLGRGFDVHSQKLLLVAGGIGIAPLIFLAEKAASDGRHVTVLTGAKTADKVYPFNNLTPGILAVEITTEDGSLGKQGMVTDLLADRDHVVDLTAVDADYLNGHDQIFAWAQRAIDEAMASIDWLKDKSVQVSMEARMGCGFGGCAGCAIETKRGLKLVCQDGPIFELTDLIR